jgi:RND family efflux transporter MFP subunit
MPLRFSWAIAAAGVLAMSPAAGQQQAVPVQVAAAEEIEATPTTWVAGTVIARDDSRLAAEVSGRLEAVRDVGEVVRAGDIVARIERRQLELQEAEAEAQIAPIRARMEFLEREAQRLEKLAARDAAARSQLDEVASGYREYAGQLEAARMRLALVRDRLQRTDIDAPFDGVIVERVKSRGERVDEGDVVVRLVDTSNLEIRARIPLELTPYAAQGSTLEVMSGDHRFPAVVRTLVPVGDDSSRLYELRLRPQAPVWLAGQAVRLAVPVSEKRRFVAVHRDALVIRQDEISVFKVNHEGLAESVRVTLGIAQGNMVEVNGNVLPGEPVVVRGNERLRPGQPVTIQERELPL